MLNNPAGYRNRLSGLAIMVMLTGCAQHTNQSADVTDSNGSSSSGDSPLDVDSVFDQANSDPRSGLSALDVERIGLGDHWNTLDKNGDGQISRQEFRQRFEEPGFQRQVQMSARAQDMASPEQAVSSSWRLPPLPPSQVWRSNDTAVPATMSTPSAAAWGVAPQTGPSEQTAPELQDDPDNGIEDATSP